MIRVPEALEQAAIGVSVERWRGHGASLVGSWAGRSRARSRGWRTSSAFETTLLALVFALIIQLITTVIKKKEEDFLDEAVDYCMRSVVAKLRLTEGAEQYKEEDLNEVAAS